MLVFKSITAEKASDLKILPCPTCGREEMEPRGDNYRLAYGTVVSDVKCWNAPIAENDCSILLMRVR